jgi:predicted DNA-binding ribbon-helix-helix protein
MAAEPAPPPVAVPEAWSRLEKHSVTVSGHRTSLSLEAGFWTLLRRYAAERGQSLNALISEIDAARSGNLSSAVRVWVLAELVRESTGPKGGFGA